MSSFNTNRRRPPQQPQQQQEHSLSDYISNLNHIPSERDLAQAAASEFKFEDDDLAMFTNANFFDFDLGGTAAAVGGLDASAAASSGFVGVGVEEGALPIANPADGSLKGMDFGDINFADFNTTTNTMNRPSNSIATNLSPLMTKIPYTDSTSSITSPISGGLISSPTPNSANTLKRKMDFDALDPSPSTSTPFSPASHSHEDLSEPSRLAAEEDKRRRNTAASARFRVKKKQREQALEKNAKEMNDKVAALEGRIGQLETENKWLKNLIVEKNNASAASVAAQPKEKRELERGKREAGVKVQ